MAPGSVCADRSQVSEQLSVACTPQIVSFGRFVALLAGGADGGDHVVVGTAPTGHALRLQSMPMVGTGFLECNDRDA
jgi:anion-transporting  ArsA/GET3 family ATPase